MSKILELAKRIASTGGLETKTTETISGTYDSTGQQRLLSHAYTIGGNLTITNGELILSRLADNGTSMTLEFGSDVTLTGDGTLMLGDLGQGQPNQDFSASRITGKLPSTIFPAGHVIQTVSITTSVEFTVTTSTPYHGASIDIANNPTFLSTSIVMSNSLNRTHVMFNTSAFIRMGATGWNTLCDLYCTDGTTDLAHNRVGFDQQAGTVTKRDVFHSINLNFIHSPNTTGTVTYYIKLYIPDNYIPVTTLSKSSTPSYLIIQEIAG